MNQQLHTIVNSTTNENVSYRSELLMPQILAETL